MPEPNEAVELRAALSRMRRTTGLPVVFGGMVGAPGRLRIAELSGMATAHGELRAPAPRIADPALREELRSVCDLLAAATGLPPPRGRQVALAPREVDALACVAAGATNAGAADRLGPRPETVKGYLRSAMRKLGAHTRPEALVAARRAGLLP
ncbi:helix-turn-helix transcriptional regulator [Streptomyces sp. NPDC051219]|uniref:helix-turn-helix transcriptional regulator n=1 Tax=Streptomyces sp. NPDC051219 TaxID=3155283 RepID=UPI0034165E14